jgi:pyruvate dehydrogenase E2 component (dihydrolipoamide acetyltransferase)
MPVPFVMPKFDMDQERAKIVSWEKSEGDRVLADEVVLVVETEKVAIEVPSPATGTLAGVCYQAGDEVPVASVIAYILQEGESLVDLPGRELPPSPRATPVAVHLAQALGVNLADVPAGSKRITRSDVQQFVTEQRSAATVGSDGSAPPPEGARGAGRMPVAATPAARHLSQDLSVSLELVAGSGPRGRVQAIDVSEFAADQAARAAKSAAATDAPAARPAEVIALAGMRQTIAERMQSSFQEAPHIALSIEVDASALESSQGRLSILAARDGVGKVSLTALLVKCAAWALARHPYLNASLHDGAIYLWRDVNIGVVTALDNGLIVPVIHQANTKSVREIAIALLDLTSRAKAGRLALADVQHGTFTISNLGMFGIHQFRAIINPPESAILAVGRVIRKPVVINDQDEVAVRPMMTLTLAADHRVIDGVVAARYLGDLMQAIEAPETLLY